MTWRSELNMGQPTHAAGGSVKGKLAASVACGDP
jgi:hypothetical protein